MMKQLLLSIYLLFTCFQLYAQEWRLSPTATQNYSKYQKAPYLILISIDGFRYDFLEKYKASNLLNIAKKGIRAEKLIPCFPTKTFPNHYTIVTGLYPDHHGIVDNSFYDPEKDMYFNKGNKTAYDGSWYGGKPIWTLAEENGMRSSTFYWIGSEAEIAGKRPSEYFQYQHKLENSYRADQVVKWLERPIETRPHVILLYLATVDDASHSFGPDTPQTEKAVQQVDQLIGQLFKRVNKLNLPVNWLIVSDHGMQTVDHENHVDYEKMADLSGLNVSFSNTMVMIYQPFDQLAEVIYKDYREALERPEYNGKFNVYLKDDLPEHLNFGKAKGVGDIILYTNPPYIFTSSKKPATKKGDHGYDPSNTPNMGGLFIANGPAFKKGEVIPPFENIHIFPLMTEILGLPSLPVDGKIDTLKSYLRK